MIKLNQYIQNYPSRNMILIYSLVVIFLVTIVIYYFLWKNYQQDKKNLQNDWEKFQKSVSENDIKGMAINGDKLIWNKHLLEQLNEIISVVDAKISNYPELKKLQNNAFNKKLHYDRVIPY